VNPIQLAAIQIGKKVVSAAVFATENELRYE
jgi:hypothetical protein